MSYAEDFGYDYYDGPEDNTPEIDFTDGYWIDTNDKRWVITEMGERHIRNCIAVLKKTTSKWDYLPEDEKEIKRKIDEFENELKRRSDPLQSK